MTTFIRDYELGPPKCAHLSRSQKSEDKSKVELRPPDFSLVPVLASPCSLLKD